MRIAKQWQDFSDTIELETAHVIQQWEMRRSFYAGALGMLNILMDIIEEGRPEEASGIITQLHDEIKNFADAVLEGQA